MGSFKAVERNPESAGPVTASRTTYSAKVTLVSRAGWPVTLEGVSAAAAEGNAKSVPKALAPGDRVAQKYVVEKMLGTGGVGQVVAARHVDLGTVVAIKVLHPHALDDVSVERFQREARVVAALKSEHVVRVH